MGSIYCLQSLQFLTAFALLVSLNFHFQAPFPPSIPLISPLHTLTFNPYCRFSLPFIYSPFLSSFPLVLTQARLN